MDILGIGDRAGAAQPRQRLGVRAAHRRRQERLRADPRVARRRARPRVGGRRSTTTSPRRAAAALDQGGLRRRAAPLRCAPPTCATSARPSRCGCRCPRGRSTRRCSTRSRGRFHAEHRALYGYDFAGDATPAGRVGQPPGLRHRPDPAAGDQAASTALVSRSGATRLLNQRTDGRSASTRRTGTSTPRCSGGPTCPPGAVRRRARRSSRSSARRCRCTRASPPGSTSTSTSS